MKKTILLFTTLLFFSTKFYGQQFNRALNKDSLLQTILKDVPENKKADLLKMYNEGNEQTKEFLLLMLAQPRSSKKELIENVDTNINKINALKTEYEKLVPSNYIVSIEFNPPNTVTMMGESIDLKITDTSNHQSSITQNWNLKYDSKELTKMVAPLGWTKETLDRIKKLLAEAKCVSIENGDITTIGFARSGMGKYFYKLFKTDLTTSQIERYNDKCTYIFYKKNIVLEYGGGAIGSQCFPD
jgi:hypothetical protein